MHPRLRGLAALPRVDGCTALPLSPSLYVTYFSVAASASFPMHAGGFSVASPAT